MPAKATTRLNLKVRMARFRKRKNATPASPVPNSTKVEGSGAEPGAESKSMLIVSNVNVLSVDISEIEVLSATWVKAPEKIAALPAQEILAVLVQAVTTAGDVSM